MIIRRNIYCQLLQCPKVPPEIGGILGGEDGIISMAMFDKGKMQDTGIKYIPNTKFLNNCIYNWKGKKISFYGFFHTHSPQWPNLSGDDKRYIETIMNSMPDEIETLYFPVVIPKDRILSFRAAKGQSNVYIIKDDIKII